MKLVELINPWLVIKQLKKQIIVLKCSLHCTEDVAKDRHNMIAMGYFKHPITGELGPKGHFYYEDVTTGQIETFIFEHRS